MHITIIANGIIQDYAATAKKLAQTDYIIACDGGLRHAMAMGRVPHCLIGDLDSAPTAQITYCREQGVQIIPYPPAKDETDLELALAHAVAKNPAAITILGALGGRFDHALGNVHVLAQAQDIATELWDEHTSIVLINRRVALPQDGYHTLSLIPLTTSVTGITTQGLAYPLCNETLHAGQARGISNTFTSDTATISVVSGQLLAIRNQSSH